MKIACICLTFNRPALLARLVECYCRLDYPDDQTELIILDDLGQYTNTVSSSGKRWTLISFAKRFGTLSEKRNAATALVAPGTEAVAIFDDDDIYLPWTLRAHAAALADADWSAPSVAINDKGLWLASDKNPLHGGWAYKIEAFNEVGGYPRVKGSDEDKGLASKFKLHGVLKSDPLALGFEPFYIFWTGTHQHICMLGEGGYDTMMEQDVAFQGLLQPHWDQDYVALGHRLTESGKRRRAIMAMADCFECLS